MGAIDLTWLSLMLIYMVLMPSQVIIALGSIVSKSRFRLASAMFLISLAAYFVFLYFIRTDLDGFYGDHLTTIGIVVPAILGTLYYISIRKSFF